MQVEIAEGVDGVPVARLLFDQPDVLRDREIESALALQALRLTKRRLAIKWHDVRPSRLAPARGCLQLSYSAGSRDSILSNRLLCGLKDRRWNAEYPYRATAARCSAVA